MQFYSIYTNSVQYAWVKQNDEYYFMEKRIRANSEGKRMYMHTKYTKARMIAKTSVWSEDSVYV